MKSREISWSKIGPFSLACTDPYIGIGWENQSNSTQQHINSSVKSRLVKWFAHEKKTTFDRTTDMSLKRKHQYVS